MLTISRKVEYGLMAVLFLADRREGNVLSAKELAQRLQVPSEVLGKVLQALARAGIVSAAQGAHGGYQLARPIDALTLGDFIEAVDGPIRLTRCQEAAERCGQFPVCTLRDPMKGLHERLQEFLQSIPVRELAETPAGEGIE